MSASGAPDDLAARKRALRSQARRAAAELPGPERARRSRELQTLLIAIPELGGATTLALYAPLRDEVQLDLLPAWLGERGCRLAYPRIEGPELVFHWVAERAALRPGARGLLEPDPAAPLASPESLDVVLVPGLLFDRKGRRLGRGGGHYDRFLARVPWRNLTIGVCLAEQLVEALPAEPHDLPARWVVTDQEVLRIS